MLRLHFLVALGFLLFIQSSYSQSELKPFVLPWDDSTPGVTDLSSLMEKPAGKYGFIKVDKNGHFAEGSKRIRFLGVNLVATSCFPPKEKADAIAARMAKFGINNVRFHHMDARWGNQENLIDYAAGSSLTISPERLDRLHYLVSKLKARGIYSNINLLVSHDFMPEDGLPQEIKSMQWKEKHNLGMFNDRILELQKKYAKDLLTAKNPYTGQTLAEDPSVSIVEIMNENGIMHEWLGGKLDALPAVFKDQLQQKWNDWLAKNYPKNEQLIKAWNFSESPLGSNLIKNGDFSDDVKGWNFERHGKAVANFSVEPNRDGRRALCVDVQTPGAEAWHVQFNQPGIELEANQIYTVTFWAKSSVDSHMACMLQSTVDYSIKDFHQTCIISGEWKQFTQTFKATSSQKALRLGMSGIGDKAAKVWFSDITFQKGGKFGSLPENVSVEKKNIPVPLYHSRGNLTPEMKSDWMRFLTDLEKKYWGGMKEYVQKTLGYKGIVMGTIIANSPPNVQSLFDAIDGHSYWAHPHFPRKDWDINDWYMEPDSMVHYPQKATITSLASQRVKGKPFTVTEYQHAFPNLYSSEAPLFVGAYGALQDWDGIWMFEYGSGKDRWDAGYATGFFDINGHPSKMANMLVAACLFLRSDLEPAKEESVYPLPPQKEIDVITSKGQAWNLASATHLGMPYWLPYVRRVALEIGDKAAGSSPSVEDSASKQRIFVSDNKQIKWDASEASGFITVDTLRSKALIGVPRGTCQWNGISIEPENPNQWMTAGICLMEGKSFDNAQGWKALAVFSGKMENTDMVWQSEKKDSVGKHFGKSPSLVEMIPLKIKLPIAASRVTIFTLNEKGERKNQVPVNGNEKESYANVGKGESSSLWYEIAVAPAK